MLPDISIPRYPSRLDEKDFYPVAYRYMYLSRTADLRFIELFKKGHVKGTVIISIGNEATTVGMAVPFRPGRDVMSIGHRDLGTHLVMGMSFEKILCQHMANAKSPTGGREGNVHYGDVSMRRMPFMSHLGAMLAPCVGGTWAVRRNKESAFGLAVIGDGGSSTGDFHECLNLASVLKIPVLFMIENNRYAFSTPVKNQYNCERLSDRAKGYGITGKTIDGTDVWEVYSSVLAALDSMTETSLPYIIESDTLRMMGHAVYDSADYVTPAEREAMKKREPLVKTRAKLMQISGWEENRVVELEQDVERYVDECIGKALPVARPGSKEFPFPVYADVTVKKVDPFKAVKVKNGTAVTRALDNLLDKNPECVILGQDIGVYGSAFKTCKGLFEKYGRERVIDMPVCESATIGFALGASQTGSRPVVEFQFADFGTEAVTQLGLNSGSWFFRSHSPAPLLVRFPCGAGINLGAFHSGEYEGLWSRFPGLKLLYPVTPQEVYEAFIAGFHDPNPVLIFEHKLLYWSKDGDIDFDGDLARVYRPRQYREGSDLTIIAWGAMVDASIRALDECGYTADVWNPFILKPLILEPIIRSVEKTGRLLVVQESNSMAGLGDTFISKITTETFHKLRCAPRLVTGPDTPVPFARELETRYLPDNETIVKTLKILMEK